MKHSLLSSTPLVVAGRHYKVDVWSNDVLVVHSDKTCRALARRQDGEWTLCSAKGETLLRAAVASLAAAPS